MKKNCLLTIVFFKMVFVFAQVNRAPAYPLITHDPYFSIWSTTDDLTASPTKHWTGTDHSLIGLLKVDGQTYRFLGNQSTVYKTILPAGDEINYETTYTESDPGKDWMNNSFDDSHWQKGKAPIGDDKVMSKTIWLSRDIWVRRNFTINNIDLNKLFLKLRHDDDVEVYLNGETVYAVKGWSGKFIYIPVKEEIKSKIKKGQNILAIHVTNTGGGALLDVGLVEEPEQLVNEQIQTAQQKNVTVNATQTAYQFTCSKVDLNLTFTSPLLINDLKILSRPVSYISAKMISNDGAEHEVELYFGASTDIAANMPTQQINAQKYTANNLAILKAGTEEQAILQKKGDDLRIDWGYMYIAVPLANNVQQSITTGGEVAKAFQSPATNISSGKHLLLNTVVNMGKIGTTEKEQLILIGYDDLYSVQYFSANLKPLWKDGTVSITQQLHPDYRHTAKWLKKGTSPTIEQELSTAANYYVATIKKCEALNQTIYNDAIKAGGENYAKICALAYRQCIAAHKLVLSPGGEILFLSKENYSNGSH